MERKEAKRIGSLLDEFVRANNLERGLAEFRLKRAWHQLLGNSISRSTKNLYIKDRKLFVTLYSSVMRNELSMMKEALLERLNEASGRNSIDDIILR